VFASDSLGIASGDRQPAAGDRETRVRPDGSCIEGGGLVGADPGLLVDGALVTGVFGIAVGADLVGPVAPGGNAGDCTILSRRCRNGAYEACGSPSGDGRDRPRDTSGADFAEAGDARRVEGLATQRAAGASVRSLAAGGEWWT
jgi:hypothetical protein